MRTHRTNPHSDQGIGVVWVALLLFFLMGAAALAVDSSEFWQQARSEQRAVDLACLAGAQELPGNPALAKQKAAEFLRPNQPGLNALAPGSPTSTVGSTNIWNQGDFVIEIETPAIYEGTPNPSVMRVKIVQQRPTRFGKVLGANAVGIAQEAYCGIFTGLPVGIFPIGVPAGWAGGPIKFAESDCGGEWTSSGNGVCNQLDVPRQSGNAQALIYNLMLGSDWPLEAGNTNDCDTIDPLTQRCGVLDKKGATTASAVFNGLISGVDGYLGRLQYGTAPNSGTRPAITGNDGTAWTGAWSKGGKTYTWNTNLLPQTATISQCKSPTTALDWFYDPWSGAGEPLDPNQQSTPLDDCLKNPSAYVPYDIDDQRPPVPALQDYERPPEYELSAYNCEDLRLVILPEGTWIEPQKKDFQITGFTLGYLLDPILEDDSGDGRRTSTDDTQILSWNSQGGGGTWVDNAGKTNWKYMSAFHVEFRKDGLGDFDVDIHGNCSFTPIPPGLEDELPTVVRLVAAP